MGRRKMTYPLTIDEQSRIPKYQQIVDGIIASVAHGQLHLEEKIPSINALSEQFGLSRDTVEKAYNILKEREVITSVKGKGFYIARTPLLGRTNVLFLVNKPSTYKMQIYNSFVQQLGDQAHTDLHIYHCDETLFLNILTKNLRTYDYYVIMPHFKTAGLQHVSHTPAVVATMNQLPENKVLLLDNNLIELKQRHAEVYQDFEDDIYRALGEGLHQIRKYNKLTLVYPRRSVYPYPKRILYGFRHFCVQHDLPFAVIDAVGPDMALTPGHLLITIEEADLVNLVKQIRDRGLRLGQDIGVVSYNDTPLKDLLGITVISTDFTAMGQTAANLVAERRVAQVRNPFRWVARESV